MFNLKAQLDKKKQEVDRERALAAQSGKPYTGKSRAPVKKVLPWNRRNKGVEERNARDALMTVDEEDKHARSREVLEAKAKLYNKMASGEVILDEESSEMFLVDFEQKSVDAWRAKRDGGTTSAAAPVMNVSLKDLVKEEVSQAAAEKSKKGDEWVEYVDVLGRTRTCRREELHLLHNIDDKLQHDKGAPTEKKEKRSLMSDDMRREEEREEWEREVAEEIEQGKDSYHYEDVRHGEVRELGVGYYSFSRSKEGREAEMKRLMKMRAETESMRKQNIESKKKDKTALQTRLEKVRQRKIKKLQEQGKKIPAKLLQPIKLKKEEEEEKKKEEEVTMVESPTVEQIPVPADTQIREWDKDKELPLWTPAEPKKAPHGWQDPHQTRDNSFAPPSSYFDDQLYGRKKRHHLVTQSPAAVVNDDDDHDDSVEVKKTKTDEPISNEDRMRRLLNSLGQAPPSVTSQTQQEIVVPVVEVAPPEPFVPAEKPIKITVKSLPKKNLLLTKSAFEE